MTTQATKANTQIKSSSRFPTNLKVSTSMKKKLEITDYKFMNYLISIGQY